VPWLFIHADENFFKSYLKKNEEREDISQRHKEHKEHKVVV